MKRVGKLLGKISAAMVLLFWSVALSAQQQDSLVVEDVVPEGYELVDSLVYRYVELRDTSLVGKDILNIMPMKFNGGNANVEIRQSQTLEDLLQTHINNNSKRTISGYRVRIFFDNKQSARVESEATLESFRQKYRDVKAYRTYVNPYFKVTVGDCRNRSEAMDLWSRVKNDFPSAFVVKENIEYPFVDQNNTYQVDTVKVLRLVEPLETEEE